MSGSVDKVILQSLPFPIDRADDERGCSDDGFDALTSLSLRPATRCLTTLMREAKPWMLPSAINQIIILKSLISDNFCRKISDSFFVRNTYSNA